VLDTIPLEALLILQELMIESKEDLNTDPKNLNNSKNMPRKGPVPKRDILADPKFNSTKVAKFINQIMQRGKKSVAEKIMYSALDQISAKSKQDPLKVFDDALDQVAPQVEVKSRRVGGATYQVPIEVKSSRKMALAMRWLVTSAKKKIRKENG
jgi:small subunit ribosomal protein S7